MKRNLDSPGKIRTYAAWSGMIDRCTNEKNKRYASYGGRGIFVCVSWSNFFNFVRDMGLCKEGLSLDRIDNDGNYNPRNCKWSTPKEQANNKRNCIYGRYKGQRLTLMQLAENHASREDYDRLRWLVSQGKQFEEALQSISKGGPNE